MITVYFEEYEPIEDILDEILKTIDIEEYHKIGILHIDKEHRRIEIHSILLKNRYLVIMW